MKKKTLLPLAIASLLFAACSDDPQVAGPQCGTPATVRDLRGRLDGCGFIFQLDDGSYLEPLQLVYCTVPSASEDPLYYFEFVDGKEVYIDYEEVMTAPMSVCMAGKTVRITCISERPLPTED